MSDTLDIPAFVSGTLMDLSDHTLSDLTTNAFYTFIRHSKPITATADSLPRTSRR